MTQPARRNQKQQVYAVQKRQLWVLLVLVLMAAIYELVFGASWVVAKSVLAGSLLHFIAQSIFMAMAYRATGARMRTQIMLNMYLGQMLKWLVTLIGFALIFIYLKPINAVLVIISYAVMQVCHSVSMLRLR